MLEYSSERIVPAADLNALFQQASWASNRRLDDLKRIVVSSHPYVGAWSGEALVGFARAVTDGRYRALVDDVVVDVRWRGQGVGGEFVGRLFEQLTHVDEVLLLTGPENRPFYQKFGFGPINSECLHRAR